ncbi:hypothetical protein EPN81_00060 [Patescibacteria group bacterium]|nr:MAG: hypothetical protein EPN81_00060 [Patescibacteria group bacterium]
MLTTGGTVLKVVDVVRRHGGNVTGVAALCNRGSVTPVDIGDVPRLQALLNIRLDSWAATEIEPCPLCARNVPINTSVGKGREFLARTRKT